jgi:hypothetical protein
MQDRSFPFGPPVASIAGVLTKPAFTTAVARHRGLLRERRRRFRRTGARADEPPPDVRERIRLRWPPISP